MKTFVAAVFAVVLAAPLTFAGQGADLAVLMKDFSRPLKGDGISFTVIHLNDKTVEGLFGQSPRKLALRVQARQNTMFYVQGSADQDTKLEIDFSVTQGGETVDGTALSMNNFEDGREVKRGERIDGVVTLGKKLDLSEPFIVENAGESARFDFSDEIVSSIAN